jgi:hypothetical protein
MSSRRRSPLEGEGRRSSPRAKLLPPLRSWAGSSSRHLREKRGARARNSVLKPRSSLATARGRSVAAGGEGTDEAREPPQVHRLHARRRRGHLQPLLPTPPPQALRPPRCPRLSAQALHRHRGVLAPPLLVASAPPLRRRRCAHRVGEGGRPPRRVKEGGEGRGRGEARGAASLCSWTGEREQPRHAMVEGNRRRQGE